MHMIDLNSPIVSNMMGGHRVKFTGSRFLKDAETRYKPIEGEALAIVYGLESNRMYCLGNEKLLVYTDHKPLVPIMNDRKLELIKNPRVRSLKDKTLMYSFETKHIAGNEHVGPDVASRYPGSQATMSEVLASVAVHDDDDFAEGVEKSVSEVAAAAMDEFRAITWDVLKSASRCDRICSTAVRYVETGFPTRKEDVPEDVRTLWYHREDLYAVDGVLMNNSRMYIPQELRGEILDSLHSAHQGEANMKNAARLRFFWPGMDADITQKRMKCAACNAMSPSQPREELLEDVVPTFPFEDVTMDFFSLKGHQYLAVADRYSGWLKIFETNTTKFSAIASKVREVITYFGVPKVVETDGGPPFNGSDWTEYLKKWGMKHRLSSAAYPQSNGRAELAVKTAKRILAENVKPSGSLDNDAVVRALLQYVNTPLRGVNESPAQIVYGRPIHDCLPPGAPAQERWRAINDGREIGAARLKVNKAYDHNEHAKNMVPLEVGDVVSIQNVTGPKPNRWDTTGRVVECLNNRQYTVVTDGSRRVRLRNRRHLRKIHPLTAEKLIPTPVTPTPATWFQPRTPATPRFLRPQTAKEIQSTPEREDTTGSGTQEEPDNAPRTEEPMHETTGEPPVTPEEPPNTPEEPLRRSQRTRKAPERFGNPIME